eukprot:366331-Chlamydomonas_euryale.AAC.8
MRAGMHAYWHACGHACLHVHARSHVSWRARLHMPACLHASERARLHVLVCTCLPFSPADPSPTRPPCTQVCIRVNDPATCSLHPFPCLLHPFPCNLQPAPCCSDSQPGPSPALAGAHPHQRPRLQAAWCVGARGVPRPRDVIIRRLVVAGGREPRGLARQRGRGRRQVRLAAAAPEPARPDPRAQRGERDQRRVQGRCDKGAVVPEAAVCKHAAGFGEARGVGQQVGGCGCKLSSCQIVGQQVGGCGL